MYLRFRKIKSALPRTFDDTFKELYEQIHGKLPDNVEQNGSPTNIKLQINLVKGRRIKDSVRQIHIATLANERIYIDEDKTIFMSGIFWKLISDRLDEQKVDKSTKERLFKKIEDFLNSLATVQ